MSNLPLEILTDIFLHLPVKSLGQCSCVCKSWCSLISNPEFAKYHLDQAISGENKLGLIIVPRPPPLALEPSFGFENIDVNGDGKLLDPDELLDIELPQIDFEIVGSCNGLICLLYFPNRFVLWNPTIKESMQIPHSPHSVDEYRMLFYGFGYDSSVDDYKLVRNVRSNNTATNLLEIYSLKANSWSCIEHVDSNCSNIDFETKNGTFLNESLHWVAYRGMKQTNEYKNYDVIVVFDIKSESFSLWEIIAPRHDRCYQLILGVLRGCLSLFCYLDRGIMVWVMKDYGVSESWTGLTYMHFDEFFYCEYVTPVCYARGDELILDVDGCFLVRYNLETGLQKYLKTCIKDWFSCVVYVESLISPNRYSIILL